MVHYPTCDDFIKSHKLQFQTSNIPEHFWATIYKKIVNQTFDAGDVFYLLKIDYEDDEKRKDDPIWQVRIVNEKTILPTDPQNIYLIDHAWTFKVENAKKQLNEIIGLRERMAFITGLDLDNVTTDAIFDEIWKYCNTYSIMSNDDQIETRMPVWYVMDELGSGIQHDDQPNVKVVPFINIYDQMTYSLLFPIKELKSEDVIFRDFLEGIENSEERDALLLPWKQKPFTNSYDHVEVKEDYFLAGHVKETLPILEKLKHQEKKDTFKVFSEYECVTSHLKHPKFVTVDCEEDADILWLTRHFKQYEELSLTPGKYVNQFPFEYVLTIKDLLPITCRRCDGNNPKWLPVTYNLKNELIQFVTYYQHKENEHLDRNLWIIKPFNLARGLDTHITNNLNYILRLPATGPKIAQKYIEKPLLFYRDDCSGRVKFDIRYVILLKNVKPLEAYVYKNFFLRFANVPFDLTEFDNYQKHFTVMNYNEEAKLKRMLCDEFKIEFEKQYSQNWDIVECEIFKMMKEVFVCATKEVPPCGIAQSPQSRALYAADLMLEDLEEVGGKIGPKLLEINWTPDCKRACEYYPDFYNDIFSLLFLDEINESVFVKL